MCIIYLNISRAFGSLKKLSANDTNGVGPRCTGQTYKMPRNESKYKNEAVYLKK